MSGLIVGLVLRLPITDDFNSEGKLIATIYADHAWDDGTHAYPSVATVARMSGFSERTVQRYLRVLESLKLLVIDGKGPRGQNKYKFPVEENSDHWVRLSVPWGVTVTPQEKTGGDTDSGDTDSGDTDSGDSIVSPKQLNKPSSIIVVDSAEVFKAYEREIGALTPMIADTLNDACNEFPNEWIVDAIKIAVQNNVRKWKYIKAILDDSKAKNIRPSLNTKEKNNGKSHSNGTSKRAKPVKASDEYSQADIDLAAKINASLP